MRTLSLFVVVTNNAPRRSVNNYVEVFLRMGNCQTLSSLETCLTWVCLNELGFVGWIPQLKSKLQSELLLR